MNVRPVRVKRKPMSDINVVPYIDVMLVLLIIFMVTAPLLTQGVDVELPQTTSEPIPMEEQNEPLIVSIDSSGAYYMELGDDTSKPLPLEEVANRVQKIVANNPKVPVLVRGDRHVAYGEVVNLMAVLQQAGAPKVGLITENPPVGETPGS